MKISAHTVPKQLKSRCPRAAFFAAEFPPREARIGVIVVPMLLPSTIAQPISNVIQPLPHIIITMANDAADDWIIMVMTMPTSTKITTDAKPISA